MARTHDTMMNPPIEELLDRVDSKFRLVTLAARRARQINSYFNQLGDGLGAMVPPQVTSVARKPLSIGFEEIAADKIVAVEPLEDAGRRTASDARRPPTTTASRRRAASRPSRDACSPGGASSSGSPAASPPTRPIEVCRRLVDAGAHVVPGHDRGAPSTSSARTTFSALASEPVQTSLWDDADPDPAHPARPGRRPRAWWRRPRPGCSAPTPPGISTDLLTATLLATRAPVVVCPAMHTEMWEHPAVQENLADAAPRAACTSSSPSRAGSPAATSAPVAWPRPSAIVAAVERVLGPRDLAGRARARHRRRHPRADRRRAGHRQPLVGQAGLRHRRRGRRRGAPRSRSSRTVELPGRRPASRSSPVETAAEMAEAVLERGADRRRRRHGRRRGRLPPGRRRPTARSRRTPGAPADRARADPRHPRRARRGASAPGQVARRLRRRDRRPRRQRQRQAATASTSTSSSPTTCRRPGVGFEHDTNAVDHPRRRRRSCRVSRSPTSGPSPRAVLDAVVAVARRDADRRPRTPPHRSTP